jgi:hypothetical protein
MVTAELVSLSVKMLVIGKVASQLFSGGCILDKCIFVALNHKGNRDFIEPRGNGSKGYG